MNVAGIRQVMPATSFCNRVNMVVAQRFGCHYSLSEAYDRHMAYQSAADMSKYQMNSNKMHVSITCHKQVKHGKVYFLIKKRYSLFTNYH